MDRMVLVVEEEKETGRVCLCAKNFWNQARHVFLPLALVGEAVEVIVFPNSICQTSTILAV